MVYIYLVRPTGKLPGQAEIEKVVPFSLLGGSYWKFVYHLDY